VELAILALQAPGVQAAVVEEEIGPWNYRHRQRQVIRVQQARRLRPRGVAELVFVVAGDHEHAVLLPLERSAGARLRTLDAGDSASIEHVDTVIHGHSERWRRRAGRNLGDVRPGHALLAGELKEG